MAVIAVGILIFCDHREQKFSTLMVERGVLGVPKHNLAPSQNTLVGTTAFQLSTSKVADLKFSQFAPSLEVLFIKA